MFASATDLQTTAGAGCLPFYQGLLGYLFSLGNSNLGMSEISDSAGRHGCPEAKATAAVADVRLFCSRMMFVRADPRETQQVVFDAHDRAFAFFGGTCIQSTAISVRNVRGTL